MENKPWLNIVNSESEDGTWDFFQNEETKSINLVKFENDIDKVGEIKMTYAEFEDLSKLIMKLNGK